MVSTEVCRNLCNMSVYVGVWRVYILHQKIKHPGGSGGFVLQTKGRPRSATQFSGFFTFVKSHPCQTCKVLASSTFGCLLMPYGTQIHDHLLPRAGVFKHSTTEYAQ